MEKEFNGLDTCDRSAMGHDESSCCFKDQHLDCANPPCLDNMEKASEFTSCSIICTHSIDTAWVISPLQTSARRPIHLHIRRETIVARLPCRRMPAILAFAMDLLFQSRQLVVKMMLTLTAPESHAATIINRVVRGPSLSLQAFTLNFRFTVSSKSPLRVLGRTILLQNYK